MSFDHFEEPGAEPQYVTPISLPYSGPIAAAPAQPGKTLATVMGVIGIVVASLTLLFTLIKVFGLFVTATVGRGMPWGGLSKASTTVQSFDALAGLLLSVVLLIGSIGLLRLCCWSRRLLNWWGLIYLAVLVLFMVLEVQIVVPDQVAMMNRMFSNMPAMMNANPGRTFNVTTRGGTTVTTWSTTMPATSPAMTAFIATGRNAAPGTPGGGPVAVRTMINPLPAPQIAGIWEWTYSLMAFGKTFICAIFPIVLLITLRMRRMRAILGCDRGMRQMPKTVA